MTEPMDTLTSPLAPSLRACRAADGGFGPLPGLPSEPEPTALAALALEDAAARAWLVAHQRRDGSFGLSLGPVDNDSATALAALALSPGPERDRALDHLEAARGSIVADDGEAPHDPSLQGWSWTRGTFGWVEPTARATLALRLLRPASATIADGLATLADRQCTDGGWNYGNPLVLGAELPGFAQTTAAAMLALQGGAPEVVRPGLAALGRLWREEREGGLSLAMSAAALRLHGHPDADDAEGALRSLATFADDTVALAWATLATGGGLERLRVAS